MRNQLKGRRVYIDTNIFVYIALRHPEYFEQCFRVVEGLVLKEFEGYGSDLVSFELFGALSRISVEAAYEAVNAYLDLPLTILRPNRETYVYAYRIAKLSKTTYDAVHAALVAQNGIEVVVTEDLSDWSRILNSWHILEEEFGVKGLTVLSPTRGQLKP